jgi:rubrerythrin
MSDGIIKITAGAGVWLNEVETLRAEVARLKGESEIQRGFFNAAMDRAEKAEAELDALKEKLKDYEIALRLCERVEWTTNGPAAVVLRKWKVME